MLILSLDCLHREFPFSIFLLHERFFHKDMALAQEQVCTDHSCVFHLDAVLRSEQRGRSYQDVI